MERHEAREDARQVTVRPEGPEDQNAVFEVHRRAFDTLAEARLVDAVRPIARPSVSLVAVLGGGIVGHVLFTPVRVVPAAPAGEAIEGSAAIALGPMAVLPELQRRGIGSRLVSAGLRACRDIGEDVVFVLGHADYYPRFGFRPASPLGLCYRGAEFDPYFMVAELRPGAAAGMTGHVRYLPVFDDV